MVSVKRPTSIFLFLMLSWGLRCSGDDAHRTNAQESRTHLFTVTKSIRAGENAQLQISLPSAKTKVEWQLLLDNVNSPAASGTLSASPQLVRINTPIQQPGTYVPVLLLNEPTGTKCEAGGEIVVQQGIFASTIAISMGPLLGALVAVFVFVVQEQLKGLKEIRQNRATLKAVLRQLIADVMVDIDTNSNAFSIADWATANNNAKWLPHLFEPIYLEMLKSIKELIAKRRAGLLSDDEARLSLMHLDTKLGGDA